jgi:hypothetical protein
VCPSSPVPRITLSLPPCAVAGSPLLVPGRAERRHSIRRDAAPSGKAADIRSCAMPCHAQRTSPHHKLAARALPWLGGPSRLPQWLLSARFVVLRQSRSKPRSPQASPRRAVPVPPLPIAGDAPEHHRRVKPPPAAVGVRRRPPCGPPPPRVRSHTCPHPSLLPFPHLSQALGSPERPNPAGDLNRRSPLFWERTEVGDESCRCGIQAPVFLGIFYIFSCVLQTLQKTP